MLGWYKWPRNVESMSMRSQICFDTDELESRDTLGTRPSNAGNRYDIGHVWNCSLQTLKGFKTLTIKIDLTVTSIEKIVDSNRNPFMIDDPVKIAYLLSSGN